MRVDVTDEMLRENRNGAMERVRRQFNGARMSGVGSSRKPQFE